MELVEGDDAVAALVKPAAHGLPLFKQVLRRLGLIRGHRIITKKVLILRQCKLKPATR